ncbi:hypothetical protein MM236_14220 [Belliella sp. DSM 107340]|uniref:Uncharacterized protein n=1 Tax=Belliella calami TaxID=2923436 RepID=A0ABS9URA0_9BACT|nr:hypothetical protein [Belliella calami]MCH7399156.1 hypothetical protein [Belliella calami]
MQETWIFKLESGKIIKEQELKIILEREHKELGIFLSYYFKKEGALAENARLKDNIDFLDENHGKFKLDFDLVHYNACLNIHDTKRDEIQINFEISKEKNEIKLIGPFFPERGMDEI